MNSSPVTYTEWWRKSVEKADRTTARQIGLDLPADMPIGIVRREIAKNLAPAASNIIKHYPASTKTKALLANANKKRAELGQPLISLD